MTIRGPENAPIRFGHNYFLPCFSFFFFFCAVLFFLERDGFASAKVMVRSNDFILVVSTETFYHQLAVAILITNRPLFPQ